MNTTLDLTELNEKIGQLFMVGLPGPGLDRGTEALIRECAPGGVILFARNIRDPVQLARLCSDLQKRALAYQGVPMLLAIDQEGGRVARLKKPFTEFPGNSAIGADDRPEERAAEFGHVTAREMRMVGLNMDLAPVVDVRRGEPERHLNGRTFGDDPELVARLGRTIVTTLQENGVLAVAKHFPGLGRADLDPHFHLPRIDIRGEEIERINLPPFEAAVEAGVSGIMTSHALYPALDPEMPATLSHRVVTGLLREKMGFEGLILTDDLEMGAIAGRWGVARGAAMAFEAGADVLLICENQGHVREAIDLLRGKLLRGEIPHDRLTRSNRRISEARKKCLDAGEAVSIAQVEKYFHLKA